MRRCNRSQIDQCEVLDDCCHMTFTLETLRPEVTLSQIHKLKRTQGFNRSQTG